MWALAEVKDLLDGAVTLFKVTSATVIKMSSFIIFADSLDTGSVEGALKRFLCTVAWVKAGVL